MAAAESIALMVVGDLFGPDSRVPGWAWLAVLVMIFGGLLTPSRQDG